MNNPRKGWTSASNAAADQLCPGRHRAQIGMADTKTDDARHGSTIHEALQTTKK